LSLSLGEEEEEEEELRVLEKKMLKENILELRWKIQKETGEHSVTKSFIICTLHSMLFM